MLTVFLWTWLTLTLITMKIKAFTMTTKPKNNHGPPKKLTTPMLPWT
uniref:ATPase 8 n=1 Tax=Crotalus aquilus TaxID=8743 RepID=F2WV31_9SAUR|nr:ATPase 8 [Crotalus aquilus]